MLKWFYKIFVPKPNTMQKNGFERLVKWLAITETNQTIETLGHIEKPVYQTKRN